PRAAGGVDVTRVGWHVPHAAEAAPLPDGEAMDARVVPEGPPGVVHDRPGPPRVGPGRGLDERRHPRRRDEAYLHALGLVRVREPEPDRLRAHRILGQVS